MANADVVPQGDGSTDVGSPALYINKIYTQRLSFGGGGGSMTTVPTGETPITTETIQHVTVTPRVGESTDECYLHLYLAATQQFRSAGGADATPELPSPLGVGTLQIDTGSGYFNYSSPIYLGSSYFNAFSYDLIVPEGLGVWAQIVPPYQSGWIGGDASTTVYPYFTSTVQSGNGQYFAGVTLNGYTTTQAVETDGITAHSAISFAMSTVLNGTQTQSHGLANIPVFCQCVLECTSPDGVFSTGDRVFVNPQLASERVGFDIKWNTTQITVTGYNADRFPYGYWIIEHNTGEAFTISSTNASKWNLIVNLFY